MSESGGAAAVGSGDEGARRGASTGRIRIAAAVLADRAGRILLVRKQGARFFMQPGGKLGDGETEVEALARELKEELGCVLVKAERLGMFSAPAANEAEHIVEAALFQVEIAGVVAPAAEIAEMAWVDARAGRIAAGAADAG